MNCSFEGLFFLKVLYVIHAKSKEIKVNIDPRAEVYLKKNNHKSDIYDEYTKRISTGLLNTVLKDAIAVNEAPTRKGRAIKINYATQISSAPPRFALFCNHPDLLHFSYIRYIENKFREAFGFDGCPIEIVVNKKNDE